MKQRMNRTSKIFTGILWILSMCVHLFAQTPAGTEIENVAFAEYRDAGGYLFSVQSPPVITTVGQGYALTISKSVEKTVFLPSDTVVYDISLFNSGNLAASSLTVTDTLSDDLIYYASEPPATVNGQSLSWNLPEIQPGAADGIRLTALVAPGVLSGSTIENVAAYETPEFVSGKSQPVVIHIGSMPDPELDKQVDRATASSGDTLNYTIRLHNAGNAPTNGTVLYDTLSDKTEFVSASGNANYASGIISWNIGLLSPGERLEHTVKAVIRSSAAAGMNVTNTASLTNTEGINVSAEATTLITEAIAEPVLTIGKTAESALLEPGDELTYTITYRNSGNGTATEVMILDTLSGDIEYVSSTGSSAYDPAESVVSWYIGTLSANMASSDSVELVVRLKTPLTNGKVITNSASIFCEEGVTESASVDVTVASAPVLSIGKSTDDTAYPGDTLLYRIDIANNGNAIATQTTVSDTLPAEIEFITASATYSYHAAQHAVNWNIGDFYPGTDSVLTILTRVKPTLTGIHELHNSAWIHAQEGSVRSNITSTSVRSLDMSITADPDSIFGNGESFTTLTATLTDASGQPLPDGTPIVFSATHGTFTGNNTVTTLSGIASVQLRSSRIDKQYLPVTVKAQMQDDSGAYVSDSTTVVFFTLVVSGIVTDTDNNPVDNAVVIIVQGDETIGTDTTGADGQYAIPVYTAGEYTIIIQFYDEFGTIQTITYTVEVTPGSGETPFIPLRSVLSGRIVDANTGQPIRESDIPVIITELDTSSFSKRTLTATYTDTSYTDSSGFWSFSGLELGTYKVQTPPEVLRLYRTGSRFITISSPGQYVLNANIMLQQVTLQTYKTVDKSRALSGDTLTYRIHYGTLEQTLSDTIRIVDPLPAELEWVNISPEHASDLIFDAYDPISHELRFYREGMPAARIDSILFRVRVKQDLASETLTITNTAMVHTPNDTVSTSDDPRSDAATQLMSPFLAVKKTVNRRVIETGDIVGYSVTLENRSSDLSLNELVITDILPPGFRYREGRSVWNGKTIDDPSVEMSGSRQVLTWTLPDTLQAGASRELKYRVIAGLESRFGENVNRAFAEGSTPDNYRISSNEASAEVILKPGMLHERGFIFGKVFYDLNGNNMHDQNEPTVKGVEIITEEGIRVTTDEYGKYSIPNVRSGSHVLRINRSTLPEGSDVKLSSSDFLGDTGSRLVRMTPSGIAKANFVLESEDGADKIPETKKTLSEQSDTAWLHIDQSAVIPAMRMLVYRPMNLSLKLEFSLGSATPTHRDECIIDEIIEFLKWQDHLFVEIIGHTDNVPLKAGGTFRDNMQLSIARAETVRKYMLENGIKAERISATGLGETKPVASNMTVAGRDANRRVEMNFYTQKSLEPYGEDLPFRVDIRYSGAIALKNVRYILGIPDGFRSDALAAEWNGRQIQGKQIDNDHVEWTLGDWVSSAEHRLDLRIVPLDHRRIGSLSELNAVLEYETPDGRKMQTPALVNRIPTQVEEVLFKIDLQGALFDLGSAVLKPAAVKALKRVGEFLNWQDCMIVYIEGFTDSTGTYERNKALSLSRAEAARDYLMSEHGIASDRIHAIGHGPDFPIADNRSAAGRALNRRIEIVVSPDFVQSTNTDPIILNDSLKEKIETQSVRNKRTTLRKTKP